VAKPVVLLTILAALCWAAAVGAQKLVPGIEFLNDRLKIPESELFDEGRYIESGVGLSFGVDRRLSYLTDDYEEAVKRFEVAVRQFRYKAEIWVYLARSYFYMNSPDAARDALVRAEELMPDLREELWQPLLASLKWEIQQRARRQQAQIDFYSTGQDEVLSLFRLYLFLGDPDSAKNLVTVSHGRARTMRQAAEMVSGDSRSAQAAEADRWEQLGERLAAELLTAGIEAPTVPTPTASSKMDVDIDERERVRVLQLRVDFYKAGEEDYLQLFQAYLDRADTSKAHSVITSLARHITGLEVQSSVAPTITGQADIEQRIEALRVLTDDLRRQLGVDLSDGTTSGASGGGP
jgi:tetratricopeptide (TPR) repeat protein